MSTSNASSLVTAATFSLEALESRLLLSVTDAPVEELISPTTGSTTVVALADLGHADLLAPTSGAIEPSTLFSEVPESLRLTLTAASLKEFEGQASTVFGTSDLLTQVVIGDGSGTAVTLPGQSTLLRGDTVEINAPVIAQHLVIQGDGSTVKLNNTITSTSNIIYDAIEVSGSFSSSPVRTITSTAGVLTIQGTLNGDNHSGALTPVNENGGVDDVVLNAVETGSASGDILISGAVGGITGNGLRHISINTQAGDVGDITFGSTVTLLGNLYIRAGENITFGANVVIGGDLIIEDAFDVRFNGTLTVAGDVRIMKAGNVTFDGNVAVTGDFTIGRPDTLSNITSVAFATSARVDFGGNGGIYTAGTINFGNNVGQSVSLRPDSFTLAAGGTITFSSSSSLILDGSTPFIITRATNVVFNADVAAGSVTIGYTGLVTGNITFIGTSNSVQSLNLTTSGSTGTVTIASMVIGSGDATITANNVDLTGAISTSSGNTTLTLKPSDVTRAIAVGTSSVGAPATRLDLNATDLSNIQPGFASVIIGDLYAGTGTVFTGYLGELQGGPSIVNTTTLAGGVITVTRNMDITQGAAFFRLVARVSTITINGVINRGSINGDNLLEEDFYDRNNWVRMEAATDITINRPVYAADRISLTSGTSGTGSVILASTGANSGLLSTINSAGANKRIELISGETSGSITLTDGVGADTIKVAGSGSSILLRANGGAITQTDGLLTASTLAAWAKDNVTLRTDVSTIGSLSLNGEILPGGSGATATANMTGAVSTLFLTSGGTGYTSAPTVSFTGGGGTGAAATAVVVGGFVTQINITNAGSGYTSAPTIGFSGGAGSGAAALALVTPGALTSFTVDTGGSAFTIAPTVTVLGDGLTRATGTATVLGSVGSYLVTSAGSSYTTIPLTPTGNATVTGNLGSGQLTSVSAVSPGSGYTLSPSVSVDGDGTGAAVLATLNGSVSSIASTAGSGYNYIPTVIVSGGRGTQAINGLQMVGTGNVSVTNTGSLTIANATTTPGATRGTYTFTTVAGGNGNISVGYLNSSTGNITLNADGAITDSNTGSDTTPNIVTSGLLTLNAKTGIGATGGADLDVTIGSLQATNSTSGNIFIQHTGLTGFTIAGTGVQTQAGNGSINLQSNALNSNTGTLTVNAAVTAHGSGNIRLEATGSQSDIALANSAADLTSTSGNLTLIAERTLTSSAGTRLTTTGGAIYIEATNGVLTMADDSLASSTGGSIRALANGNVTLGGLNADTGSVSVLSNTASILDGGDAHRDIVGGSVRLIAATGVGASANALEITAVTLSASAGANGITLVEANDLTVASVSTTTTQVNLDGTTTAVTDLAQSDLATTGNGSISLTSTSGTITLQDGDSDNFAVSANGTGNVLLTAGAAIDAQSAILSGTGHISVLAATTLSFTTAAADITTNGGTVDLLATSGSLSQVNGAVVSTTSGNIRAQAGQDVTVASFNAGTASVSVTAGRDILDGGDTDRDIIASTTRLVAVTTTGAAANALDLNVTTVAASAGSGGINLSELNDLTVDTVSITVNRVAANHTTSALATETLADLVTTGGGPIKVVSGGNLTLNKGDADDESVDAAGAGTIDLTVTSGTLTMEDGAIARTGTGTIALTASGDIALSILSSTSGNITVTAGSGPSTSGAITDNLTGEAANLLTSGLATLDAETGIGATGTPDLDTALGSLTARNRTSGDIVIQEADALTIASPGLDNDVSGASIILSSDAGTLTVSGVVTATGSGNILLTNSGASSDITATVAISTGTGGNISLLAARSLSLNTGASVATLGTGTLDLEAGTGAITFANNVAATSGTGHIRLLAATNITVTGLSTSGSATLTATAGYIADAGETLRDIVAYTARLSAATNIGVAGSATTTDLETTLDTLASAATTGIRVTELDDLTIGTVAALSVNRVALDATTSAVGDTAATSDLTATTGNIILSTGGELILTEGFLTSTPKTAVSTTDGGNISLTAVNNLTFEASVVSTSGNITLASTTAALVDATTFPDEASLVITTGLATLNAATGVGTSGAGDIDTTVGTLRGTLTTSGGFFVEETDTLTVASAGIVTQANNAPVSLVVTSGNLTVDGVITAHGSGNIHVNTKSGTATSNAAVSSTSGHITFRASGDIALKANLATGFSGTLNIVSSAGSINQDNGTRILSGTGNIRLAAANSVALASLSTTGNASVLADTGAITDSGDTHVDAIADQLYLRASTAIGTGANHLETTVTTLSARAGAGGMFILESDGLTVGDTQAIVQVVADDTTATDTTHDGAQSDLITVSTSNGHIVLRSTTGNIVLDDGTATSPGSSVSADGSGNVLIDALAGSITVNEDSGSTSGDVTLRAYTDLNISADVNVYTTNATTVTIGTMDLAATTGSFTMAANAGLLTTTGDIRITVGNDTTDHATIGRISTNTGNVSIDATGSILDADVVTTTDDSLEDIAAAGLRLQAGLGIGTGANHLETTVTTLSARATAPGIFITESDTLVIGDIVSPRDATKAVTVETTGTTGVSATQTVATQSDLITTAGNGSIVINVLTGHLTLNVGTATVDTANTAVSAHGSGNIRLSTVSGNIIAASSADILSTSGDITLRSSSNINLDAGVDVTTGNATTVTIGTVDLRASSGDVTMATTATVNTTTGDIRILANGNATIGRVNSTLANVSIESEAFYILDADADGDSTVNITAQGLRLVGFFAIGSGANHLETTVSTLAAATIRTDIDDQGLFITETDGLTVGTIISPRDGTNSITVETVGLTGATTTTTEAQISDLTTSRNGSIVLVSTDGNITLTDGLVNGTSVSANGSGSILISAPDVLDAPLVGNLIVDETADIRSGTGHITLKAHDDISLASGVDVATSANGTVSIDADTATLTMHGTAKVTATGSSARLRAAGNLTVGNVTATNVSLLSMDEAIINAASSTKNVTATNLRLNAYKSIGAADRHLTTNIATVTAFSGTGSIYITEDNGATVDDVAVTVTDFNSDATTTSVGDSNESDLSTGGSSNGNIVLVATLGDLTLNAGTARAAAIAVRARGTGNVLLRTADDNGTITLNADVRAGSGHLTVNAGSTLTLNANIDVATSAPGTISLNSRTSGITMAPSAAVASTDGTVRVRANGEIVLGSLTSATVSIDSDAGNVNSATGVTTNVTATDLRLQAQGRLGRGSSGSPTATPLSLSVDNVSAYSVTDGIFLTEADGITVTSTRAVVTDFNADATTTTVTDAAQSDLTTGNPSNGHIVLTATLGDITLNDGNLSVTQTSGDSRQANGSAVTADGSGNIRLHAVAGSITANADLRSTSGDITLVANFNLGLTTGVDVVTGNATTVTVGTLDLAATTGNLTMAANATLQTTTGDIRITVGDDALDQVVIGDITASAANVSITTTGSILDADIVTTTDDSDLDVTSLGLSLSAGQGIGLLATNSFTAATNALETSIDTLAANTSGSDGINIVEANGVSVDTVMNSGDATSSVVVQTVSASGSVSTTTVDDASDLYTTTANGSIVLRALAGNITLNDGAVGAGAAFASITAHGSGRVFIDSEAGNVVVYSRVRSTTGHITIKADDDITVAANVDIIVNTAGNGGISLDAETGSLTMDGSANVSAIGSIARLRAQGDLTVGNVSAFDTSLLSATGALINAATSTRNVTGTNLRLNAATDIGTTLRHLTTSVDVLSARSATGSLFLSEANGVTVSSTRITVTEVTADATTSTVTDLAQSDLVTAANGNIVLFATLGNITLDDGNPSGVTQTDGDARQADGTALSAHGTGNILVQTDAGSITANADLTTTSGDITLLANTDLVLTAGVDVTTGNATIALTDYVGTLNLVATTGAFTMAADATLQTTTGDIRVAVGNDNTDHATIGRITTSANVSLAATGSILDADTAGDTTTDITASGLRLIAGIGAGTGANHLETTVTTLAARATSGGIFVTESDTLTIGDVSSPLSIANSVSVESVALTGVSSVPTTEALTSDVRTTGGNGTIVLAVTTGHLTLTDGTATADNTAVSANGSGRIRLETVSASHDILAQADILSGSGHITVLAGRTADFAATADITVSSGAGTVFVNAGDDITQADNSRISTFNGHLRLFAADTITLGGVTTNTNASLVATTGSILDAGDLSGGADIIANNLQATAAIGLGASAAALEVSLGTIAARATSGGIYLTESDALTVGGTTAIVQSVGLNGSNLTTINAGNLSGLITTADNGIIDLRSLGGTITFDADSSTHGSGAFNITTTGAASSISLGAVVSSTTGNLTLNSGYRILETTSTETPVLVTTGVLSLTAVGGLGQTGRADLDVSAPTLNFTNTGTGMAYLKSHSADATLTTASLVGPGSLIFSQTTGGLTITDSVTVASGSATFRVAGALTVDTAALNTSANLSISAASLAATGSTFITGSSGTLAVTTSGNVVLDATTTLTGGDILLTTGGTLALGQVTASGLLDIQAQGSVTTTGGNTTSLVAGQLRLSSAADLGTTLNPLRVSAGVSDVNTSGALHIINLNSLTLGRGGLQIETDEGETKVIAIEGTNFGSIGGAIVDNGTGTLRLDAVGTINLATPIFSTGGNILLNVGGLTDGTAGEGVLLSAPLGRVTINSTTGVGATGTGDIEILAAEIQATTGTGNLIFEALGSINVAGTGLVATGGTGTIGLTVSTGNLTVAAPVTHSGAGNVLLAVSSGTLSMTTGQQITTSTGTINLSSTGTMTVFRVLSTTGVITATSTQGAITALGDLNYNNFITGALSIDRPQISAFDYFRVRLDSAHVRAIGPSATLNINRGTSTEIDLSLYSFSLTGNVAPI